SCATPTRGCRAPGCARTGGWLSRWPFIGPSASVVPARCTRLMRVTAIRPAADADAAQWLLRSDVDWRDLVRYGPPGFEVYVRIALPQYRGADASSPPGGAPADAVRAALTALGSYTATPSEGYAAIWAGWTSR